jgi:K+/H+ antiporter YhaU regulatory subunit KhtT
VLVTSNSPLVSGTIADVRRRFLGSATLVAVRRASQVVAPVPDDLVVRAGDTLAVTGTEVQLQSINSVCAGQQS